MTMLNLVAALAVTLATPPQPQPQGQAPKSTFGPADHAPAPAETPFPLPCATPACLDRPNADFGAWPFPGPLRVVATLPVYAELVRTIAGDAVEVTAIADPAEDAHFVRPKPSYALRIRQADAFVTTGLDLELWVPALLDKAGNAKVKEGGQGYITAYPGIELLDVPTSHDRSQGDIHIYGNPHLFTDPLNVLQIARNITAGLKNVDAGDAAMFDAKLAAYTDRLYRRLYGDALVDMLGGATLERLSHQGKLLDFLAAQDYQGQPLTARLGGWLGAAQPFRGRKIVCYHKNWAYFENRFGVTCVDYVEAKPGIPPTPGHVGDLIDLMKHQGINVLLAANYFDPAKVKAVAARAGGTAVIVPLQPGGPGTPTYFDVVDRWVGSLAAAFAGS